MKKIAYIELDTHAEIAQNVMELLQNSEVFSVTFFISPKIAAQFERLPKNAVITTPGNLLEQMTSDFDLVIIGTAHRYFNIFYEVTKRFRTAIITHNLHFSALNSWQLSLNIFKGETIFRLKLLLKESLLKSSKIYSDNQLFVLDKSLTNKKFRFLPVLFKENIALKPSENILKIVVPGSVSQKRRDILHILKSLKNYHGKDKIEIAFAGKASGEELTWLENFEKTNHENVHLKFFKNKISQEKFTEILSSADVIWCPVQRETKFFGQTEIYGQTKMSGNLGDAVKFSKPAVFPKDYKSGYSFIFQEEQDVFEQFFRLKAEGNFKFREDFSKEKVRKNLEKILLDSL